jgi:mannan endo-1,4-beta-mannosidase
MSAQKTAAFYSGGYQTASPSSDGYLLSYLNYATAVAQHYAGNSTIAFWQLVNEIDPSGCSSASESAVATAIHDFGNTMATALKAVDPNHLVSLGTQGSGQCGTSGTFYAAVHSNTAIDMCEYHDYSEAVRAMPTGAGSTDTGNGLQTRLNQCQALGLPVVVGESGILADVGPGGAPTGTVTSTTLEQRAQDFAAKLQTAFAAGVDGYLIWEGIPEASDSSANVNDGKYGVGPGDPSEASMLVTARAEGAAPLDTPEAPQTILLPLLAIAVIAIAARRRALH